MKKSTFFLPGIVLVIVTAMSSLFVVDEREKALVLRDHERPDGKAPGDVGELDG